MSIHSYQECGTTEDTRECLTIVRIVIGDSPIPRARAPQSEQKKEDTDQPPDRLDHKGSPDPPIGQHHKFLIRMDRWVG